MSMDDDVRLARERMQEAIRQGPAAGPSTSEHLPPDPHWHQRLMAAIESHHPREELYWSGPERYQRVGSGWPLRYRQKHFDSDLYLATDRQEVFVTDDGIYGIQCFRPYDKGGSLVASRRGAYVTKATVGIPASGAWLALNSPLGRFSRWPEAATMLIAYLESVGPLYRETPRSYYELPKDDWATLPPV